jgi:SAM-dependent methyltransferase
LPSDEDTLQFYGQSASIYVERGAGHVSRHLPSFLERLPANSRILELGCGGGYDARAMMDAGHVVDPTDGSPEMAGKAQALLGVPVPVMRFDELDADALYDGVWASASLLTFLARRYRRYSRGYGTP